MEPKSSSPCSQELANCPYPGLNKSNTYPQPCFPKIHLNVIANSPDIVFKDPDP
jgi:hypothetical protein